jgi:UDP-N-acetylglucosamine--N-acetylmuramyl-(pentapeptide) pyrophosphoryl-undecaprenol N-acetylglucosamine transferase
MKKPIAFFVHHQGRGHANRTMAVAAAFAQDRPVSVLTAGPQLFDGFSRDIEIVPLPNMIGAEVPTPRLYAEPTPQVMHCVPLGLTAMRRTMRRILDHLDERDVGLFVVDVSAEIALLARIASVPAVQIRMHGDRTDIGHVGAYEACVGMLAPFDARMEQDDYPAALRAKTFYSGGLCTSVDRVPDRAEARDKLGLDPDREIVVAVTGGGGSGTPYAPLTVAARAAPEALWLTLGPTHREGHETDFANLRELGWVPSVTDYLAAADIVVASAGDNTIHEVAGVALFRRADPQGRSPGPPRRRRPGPGLARRSPGLARPPRPGPRPRHRPAAQPVRAGRRRPRRRLARGPDRRALARRGGARRPHGRCRRLTARFPRARTSRSQTAPCPPFPS